MVLVTASRIPFHADSGRTRPVNINVNDTNTISTLGVYKILEVSTP
jgi:hypothetical protein